MNGAGSPRPHKARRRFGQNFLTDETIVEQIINAVGVGDSDHIVEIGPGLGALTTALVGRCKTLDVIELDRDLARELPGRIGPGAKVHQADALKFDFRTLLASQPRLRVIGNLPYNISSPLLFHLLDYRDVIEDMYFMLQLEVVDRLAASPGGRSYGRLSIVTQLLCTTDKLFEVAPESFAPIPKVRSAVIRLGVRKQPAVAIADPACFDDILRRAFSQRRKTLRNTLKEIVSARQWAACEIDSSRRPETLHLVEFARLSNEVSG